LSEPGPSAPVALAAILSTGEPERLYSGLSALVSTASEGRAVAALATFGALACLLDRDLLRRAQEPDAAPSLSWGGREAFAASLVELRELAFELDAVSLYACSASVETMGLEEEAIGAFAGVLSMPRFLRAAEGARLVFV
jgi:peroxiredoxin family protein